MAHRRYRRIDESAAVPGQPRRWRPPVLAMAAAAAALIVAGAVVGSWPLWLSPSREAAAIDACGGPECQVAVLVAADGSPLAEPLSFALAANTAVEIDFAFWGLPVAPEQLRLLTPEDQRWLVAEGTLAHPETWPAPLGQGPAWVANWDRAGNGRGPLRRWWRADPLKPWTFALESPPALQSPSLGYLVGADALLTVPAGTPAGYYSLALEVSGTADGREVTARARLVVNVTLRDATPLRGESPNPLAAPSTTSPENPHGVEEGENCSDCHS